MANKKALYQIIVERLREDIQEARLVPGDKIPTEHELARTFEVSRITASRAVKELEGLGMVHRVKGKGSFITDYASWRDGERPGAGGLSLVSLILPFGEQVGYGVLHGVESICKEQGHYAAFHNSTGDPGHEREIVETVISSGVQGLIVYPSSSTENLEIFSKLTVERFPFVVIDRVIVGLNAPFVGAQNLEGTRTLVRYLIGLGHRRIAFIASPILTISSVLDRFKGYCEALVEAGVPLRARYIHDDFVEPAGLTGVRRTDSRSDSHENRPLEHALRIVDDLFSHDPPTALVVMNDVTAIYVLKAVLARGLRVPEDLTVTGFDNLPITEHLEVPLTTVEQPFYEIGRQAARMLIRRVASPDETPYAEVVPTQLVVRRSSAPPAR